MQAVAANAETGMGTFIVEGYNPGLVVVRLGDGGFPVEFEALEYGVRLKGDGFEATAEVVGRNADTLAKWVAALYGE